MERAETPRTTVPRPRAVLGALAALALALGAIAGPATTATAAKSQPPGASRAADPARTATVMTRNLYLGADLGPVVRALTGNNPQQIVLAATDTWEQVVASHPEERMGAVADEIVAEKPHAVGLQEVTRWTTYDYDPTIANPYEAASNPSLAYDFLDLLLAELAERGVTYREVSGATATNFTSPPIAILPGNRAVSLQDRDVIIVRDGVKATNAQSGNFEAILGPPDFPVPADRGWGSADLRTKLATFRFVNSHTEAFSPEELRVAEVLELLAEQERITEESGALPTVYAGDYNSQPPTAAAYLTLLGAGLHDLWTQANPGATAAQGATCCQDADLRNQASDLTTRIDLLLGTEGVRARSAERTGDEPVTLPDGVRWASDHAGVVADVVIPRP